MKGKKDIVDISAESKALIHRYIKNRMDAYKLDVAENLAKFNTWLLAFFVFTFIVLLIAFFLSFAAAWQIGTLLDSLSLGFLLIAVFWMLVIALMIVFKRSFIELPMLRKMIKILFHKG